MAVRGLLRRQGLSSLRIPLPRHGHRHRRQNQGAAVVVANITAAVANTRDNCATVSSHTEATQSIAWPFFFCTAMVIAVQMRVKNPSDRRI
jgi:hypothetical protein